MFSPKDCYFRLPSLRSTGLCHEVVRRPVAVLAAVGIIVIAKQRSLDSNAGRPRLSK